MSTWRTPAMCSGAVEEQAGRASETTQQLVIKDELVWRILSEGAPCARLTSSQYNLTSICLRSLVLRLVVKAISPTAQFLGEPPQHLLSVAPCLWNDVGLDVLDGALHLGFHLTGGLLEGLRYSSFLSHTGSIDTPRQASVVLARQQTPFTLPKRPIAVPRRLA